EVVDRRDDELVPGRLFELFELGGEVRFLGRRDDVGLIDDAPGELGKGLGSGGDRHKQSEEEGRRQGGPQSRETEAALASVRALGERGKWHSDGPIARNRPWARRWRWASPRDRASSALRRGRSWRR